MSITSRRRAKLIGGALFAASLAAGSFATVSNVSADLGDNFNSSGNQGYIRVQPTGTTTWENQIAPVVMAGTTGAVAGSVQLMIPANWEAGDIITLQVQNDGATAEVEHTTNCLSAPQSIGFTTPYAAANVTPAGPYNFAGSSPWARDDGGTGEGTDEANNVDTPVADATASTAPSFIVYTSSSPSCGGAMGTVKDQINVQFTNTATVVDGGVFVLTFAGIKYDIGAAVQPGPVHVIPFAVTAVDNNPGVYAPAALFGTNTMNPYVATYYTDNAYVSPVTIAATGVAPIVADGTTQALGTVTLTELVNDALVAGNHYVCFSNVTSLGAGPFPVSITGGTTPTGTAVLNVANDECLTLNLTTNATISSTKSTIVISGLTARTSSTGQINATLIRSYGVGPLVDAGNWPTYLTPDDQFTDSVASAAVSDVCGDTTPADSEPALCGGDNSEFSDVNNGLDPMAPLVMAVGLPDRIGGNDRYQTSSKIAANVAECTPVVVIASGTPLPNGQGFADALSANYLAGALGAKFDVVSTEQAPRGVPVLLVTGDTLPQTTAEYLNTAGVGFVYIVGGTAAVSQGIEDQLAGMLATDCDHIDATWNNNQKIQVTRVGGADRWETNRNTVNLGSDLWGANSQWNLNRIQLELLGPGKRTAIVATGTGFADALAAGPVAYRGLPLILTDGTSLSAAALGALQDLDIEQVIIIGGTSAVSDAVRAEITGLGILTGRVSGANRYATAAAWASFARTDCATAAVADEFDCGLDQTGATAFAVDGTRILLASGVNFADALSGGPLGAVWDSSIMLTAPAALSAETAAWLTANTASLNTLTVLGLGQAVSTLAMNSAMAAISIV